MKYGRELVEDEPEGVLIISEGVAEMDEEDDDGMLP